VWSAVEFVQDKSELKVEDSRGCRRIRVLGRLTLRKRQQKLETFIFIKVPAWNSEVPFLPGHTVYVNPNHKDKGFCLDLEVDTIKTDEETLEDFWERCRKEPVSKLAWSTEKPASAVGSDK
jgi:hypothetical protein